MAASVTPERILKELSELWTGLGKSESAGMLRACSMTLIVAADEEEEASVLGEMLAELVTSHPSRAIVLRVRDGDDPELESRVTAQCWMPFGRRQQICCEEIDLRSSEGALHELPRVVLGLVAPDLPVVLICRTPNLFLLPGFEPLLHLVGKVVVDSRRSDRHPPAIVLQQIARRRAEGHDVHDLAWTAITEWRETIAHSFENREVLAALHHIQHISITCGAPLSKPEAWYLASWLARGIGVHAGVEIRETGSGESIRKVELRGEGIALEFSRQPGAVIHTVRNGVANSMPFAVLSDWDLLRAELSILTRDRTFCEVLPKAIALAGG